MSSWKCTVEVSVAVNTFQSSQLQSSLPAKVTIWRSRRKINTQNIIFSEIYLRILLCSLLLFLGHKTKLFPVFSYAAKLCFIEILEIVHFSLK